MSKVDPGQSSILESSFVPPVLKRQFFENPDRKIGEPIEEFYAAVLWIDISNFSPLCNRLMKDPATGVEQVTAILHDHYEFLSDIITSMGGQPLFFVGDGLLSAWPGKSEDAHRLVNLAVSCAGEILQKRKTTDDEGKLLSLHAVVAEGMMGLTELEGMYGHTMLTFYGEVFSDLSRITRNRALDTVLVSGSTLNYLPGDLPRRALPHDSSELLDFLPPAQENPLVQPELAQTAVEQLKHFIPRTLTFPMSRERLKWIAEIRPVTVLFVRLPNKWDTSAENLSRMQELTRVTVPVVAKYEGLLSRVWIDEKETNMLIWFGPPPSEHVDNVERSVKLAMELESVLSGKGFMNSIGVSSGKAYCGILGNDILREYSVLGDVVNLSSRIAGIKNGAIYCDELTYKGASKSIHFHDAEMARLKGWDEPIPVYEPIALKADEEAAALSSVGRTDELNAMMEAYKQAIHGNGGVVTIDGNSGMGKSNLLSTFRDRVMSTAESVWTTTANHLAKDTPYNVWGNIFTALMGLDYMGTAEQQEEARKRISDTYGERVSLLNIVLQTSFPDSDAVRQLTAAQRVQATHDLLLDIIRAESDNGPVVIIIDDAQWMDEISWTLLESVNKQFRNILIVMSIQNVSSDSYMQFDHLDNVISINLSPLTEGQVEELISAKLAVQSVSANVISIVHQTAKGNPFFCLELLGSLHDQEMLIVDDGAVSLSENVDIEELALPDTVRGALRKRIDRLDQGSRLSLKVGSVIGQSFGTMVVSSIYPIEDERASVPGYLNEAKQSGFISDSDFHELEGYFFNNATTAEVAYEMTLGEQRRHLHRASAEWYERTFADNLTPFFVGLAHHWEQAGNIAKASEYLERECNKLVSAGFTKQAIELGIKGINLFDIEINTDPETVGQHIGQTMGEIGALMDGKTIDSLMELPELTNPETERLIVMLTHIGPYTYIGGRLDLFVLLSVLGLRITLEQGHTEATADVYSMYAIVYRGMTGDSQGAYDWSKLAIRIDKKHGGSLHSRVAHVHAWFLNHWIRPIEETFPVSKGGIDAGLSSGDVMFGCFNLSGFVVFLAFAGRQLDEVIETGRKHFGINNMRVVNAAFHIVLEMQVAKALQGTTTSYTSFTDDEFSEEKDVASILDTDFVNQKGFYYIGKTKIHTHYGEWEKALEWAAHIPPIYPAIAHQIGEIEYEMFKTISELHLAFLSDEDKRAELIESADASIAKANGWAAICAENFQQKAMMLEALREGLFGDLSAAEDKFKEAARLATAHGFINDKALILEQLTRVQVARSAPNNHLSDAIQAWNELGAFGKAEFLQSEFGS